METHLRMGKTHALFMELPNWLLVVLARASVSVGAKSDRQVNICSFAVRCDRMWPSTQ